MASTPALFYDLIPLATWRLSPTDLDTGVQGTVNGVVGIASQGGAASTATRKMQCMGNCRTKLEHPLALDFHRERLKIATNNTAESSRSA
ncbi:hypothetical protein PCASD_25333 [Puccinia coronata f. sp. avenae]|uniref:Uncharacterized protein n=1 Tax=Puccinia coronata f. sp. avenae TaxID=200324 RepID=A0A2N5TJI3_9BASI|nr:hypothetical protein PCASD_25333 [Puccinia coronata f. sp. avenae]